MAEYASKGPTGTRVAAQAASPAAPRTRAGPNRLAALSETISRRPPVPQLTPSPGRSGSGLPAPLLRGIERLSGLSLEGVRVHRGSTRPATLGARAFAQGNDIHLGPGQDRHLPHEAWHVVQQRQGRVRATTRRHGAAINDDSGLESEADRQGAEAARIGGGSGAPAVAQAFATGPVSGAIQLLTEAEITKSLANVASYSPDTIGYYTEPVVRATLIEFNLTVRGHASGGAGDNQNAQTTADLRVLTQRLRERASAARRDQGNNNNSASSSSSSSGSRHSKEQEEKTAREKAEQKKAREKAKQDAWQQKQGPKKDGGGKGDGAGAIGV